MKAALIALALLATPAAADTNLLINGDFRGGTYNATAFSYYSDTIITKAVPNGWSATPGYFSIWNGCCVFLGNNLSPDPIGGISQTFADIPGQTYLTTFNLALTYYSGIFEVLLNDTQTDDGPVNGPPLSSVFYIIFVLDSLSDDSSPFSFTFVGTGLDTLTFAGASGGGNFLLQDVSVTAVPEPGTWVLMLIGFAFFGLRQFWPGAEHE